MTETTSRVHILQVEDNPDDLELTAMALEDCPWVKREVVRDGQAAIDFLMGLEASGAPRHPPDFVLLDLHLPKLDGLEVTQEIRKHRRLRNIPVIMLSASGRPEDVEAAYECGVNSYVQKPGSLMEFERTLKVILEYWGQISKLPPEIA